MFAAKVRKGQPQFRLNLRRLYDDRCAISGWGPIEMLEAAHIYGHAESGVNEASNGLLIRADLHSLMDADLLSIDPETLTVRIDETLQDTPYWDLDDKPLRERVDGSRPSKKYLRKTVRDMRSFRLRFRWRTSTEYFDSIGWGPVEFVSGRIYSIKNSGVSNQ